MDFSRLTHFSAVAFLLSFAAASNLDQGSTIKRDPNSICYSYGVDFIDEGHYFINSLSNESFTCASTFKGCNEGFAEVLLVDPAGDEFLCSRVDTTPEDKPQLSTCPILKNQMSTGEHIVLILGNNGDGQPFAWERDIYLDVGPQITTTYTPTITFNITTTPVVTSTATSTLVITTTLSPNTTYTIPSATAKRTKTITPPPVTTTIKKTFTHVKTTWTKSLSISTKTVTATCTTSTPNKPDKPCTYSPTLLHPEALVTPTGTPKFRRFMRRDRAVDVEYARARIEAAKLKRAEKAAAPQEKRAADEPTLTITAPTPIDTTITYTAPATTTTESTVVSSTTTSILPPVTIYSGTFTSTITLPTPTKTRFSFLYTTSTTTKTIQATWTRTTTITPSATLKECKKQGGHVGWGRW